MKTPAALNETNDENEDEVEVVTVTVAAGKWVQVGVFITT